MTKKIKPDGWTKQDYKTHDTIIIYPTHAGQPNNIPICLIPPELLEWVEEMRDFFDCSDTGYEKGILDKLNKIWPKKD